MLEASGWETRGFVFYWEFNNRTLRGVLRAAAARDRIVLLWVERWFYARIAGFRQLDCNRLVLDEPITCNHRRLQLIRYRRHGERLAREKCHFGLYHHKFEKMGRNLIEKRIIIYRFAYAI